MKRMVFRFAFALFVVFVPFAHAKGPTCKILVTGGNLSRGLEIVDARVLQNFRIWSGPGTSSVAESEPLLSRAPETFIVANWSPLAAPPSDLMRYQVSFMRITTRTDWIMWLCTSLTRRITAALYISPAKANRNTR